VGVLEIESRGDLDAEQLRTVSSMLRVYRNVQGLLDYSERDMLTGLLNRKTFDDAFYKTCTVTAAGQAPAEARREARRGMRAYLGIIDIDHFKLVNDRFGHQRGDEVLVEFRNRVTGSVRDIDTFARYGGEEFVLILPETNLEGGLAVAEKLRAATHRTPFCDDGIRLTVSIGVACFPEHATATEELLRAADEALYEAKLQGRDRVVTAGPRLLPLTARPGQVKGRAARVE
jgi:diguanylate cyclase (GGDEF)-like protein